MLIIAEPALDGSTDASAQDSIRMAALKAEKRQLQVHTFVPSVDYFRKRLLLLKQNFWLSTTAASRFDLSYGKLLNRIEFSRSRALHCGVHSLQSLDPTECITNNNRILRDRSLFLKPAQLICAPTLLYSCFIMILSLRCYITKN
jgi:hypothetical protein